jgi:hypothetical protein
VLTYSCFHLFLGPYIGRKFGLLAIRLGNDVKFSVKPNFIDKFYCLWVLSPFEMAGPVAGDRRQEGCAETSQWKLQWLRKSSNSNTAQDEAAKSTSTHLFYK